MSGKTAVFLTGEQWYLVLEALDNQLAERSENLTADQICMVHGVLVEELARQEDVDRGVDDDLVLAEYRARRTMERVA